MAADQFRTTRWILILAAGRSDEQARATLAQLCEAYWKPVDAFIRRKRHTPEAAADLTQAFILHLLEHRSFERADQSRGRFRTYQLTAALFLATGQGLRGRIGVSKATLPNAQEPARFAVPWYRRVEAGTR